VGRSWSKPVRAPLSITTAMVRAGDFLHVPAWTPHMEINPSKERPFRWIVVRSTPEPIVVNLPDDYWG
jgi:uncharacterized RmlC-like cupin family protein